MSSRPVKNTQRVLDMVCTSAPVSSLRKPQVLPGEDGSPKVVESTKQTSFCVTLLLPTLVRESTSEEIITLNHWSSFDQVDTGRVTFTTDGEDICRVEERPPKRQGGRVQRKLGFQWGNEQPTGQKKETVSTPAP